MLQRPIRSFVRRGGHVTPAQRRALEQLWPRYGVELQGALDLTVIFGRRAPLILEIGFGNGEALATLAAANPDNNYLGVEVHRPGIGHLLRELSVRDLNNVRVICADANEVLVGVPDETFAAVHLFFPDPWPKKRHHKRRLVQPAFADAVRRKLAPKGIFHLATDWEDYAAYMLAVLSVLPGLENIADAGGYTPRPEQRPLTKFERRGQRLGHVVRDVVFRRCD